MYAEILCKGSTYYSWKNKNGRFRFSPKRMNLHSKKKIFI